jgi:transcriptional regulator with XRE-family HTH domain
VAPRRSRVAFGQTIVELRRSRGLNQRALAEKVRKEEGGPISQQYLNDIENGRRNPSSHFLINELAKALETDPAYLSYIAGRLPQELEGLTISPEALRAAIDAFIDAAKAKRRKY